jgi:hypothetical protein
MITRALARQLYLGRPRRNRRAAAAEPPAPATPNYLFHWDMEQLASNWPTSGYGSGNTLIGSGGGALSTDYARSGVSSFKTANAGFSSANWYNDEVPSAPIFGTLEKGALELWWIYPGSFTAGRMLCQITTKSVAVPAYDTNEAIGIRTVAIGGTSDPGVNLTLTTNGADITLVGSKIANPTPGTLMRVRARWDINGRYKAMVQVDDEPPSWSTATFGPLTEPNAHLILLGNDVPSAYEFYLDDFTLWGEPVEDFSLDASGAAGYVFPCSNWQDFEFDTLSQANLEARDHASGINALTWNLSGTTSRLTTSTAASRTAPHPINFQTDTGTRGLVNDLTQTAQANLAAVVTASSSQRAFGFYMRLAQGLTSGTTARVAFAGSSATSIVCAVDAQNTAGQHEILLRSAAASNNVSSVINIAPDTWYWVTVLAHRNNTCTLRVFNADTGAELSGSGVTCTGSNNNIDRFAIGSNTTSTAQSSGAALHIDNLVIVNATPGAGEFPLLLAA